MKKLLSTLLKLTMIISMLSGFALVADAADTACLACNVAYVNGFCICTNGYQPAQQISASHHPELNSTHSGYYAIENAGQLYWFAGLVNGTLTNTTQNTSAKAVLVNDITANSGVLNADGSVKSGDFIEWTPIGNSTYKFSGTFDGNNHTISGLYLDVYESSAINATNSNKYVGLFGYANNAEVKNITIKDSFFGGYEWVGGIAGCFWGNSGYMENCVSYATVKGLQRVGGIAGGMQYADATNCHNHGLVTGSNMTGGFTGGTGYAAVFTNCSNTGTVKWISGSNGYLGGFVADASQGSGTNRAKFVNCFNSGDIIYDSTSSFIKQIGGFASMINGTYENCYSSGSVIINENATGYKIGGFGGGAYSNLTITNCYYDNTKVSYGAVNDADRDGVTGKSTTAFTSGEVCYLLNNSSSADTVIWKQTLTTDATPDFDGLIVYYDGTKYYNIIPELTLTLTTSDVTIENLAESAILIVASYNGDAVVDVKPITVSADCTKTIESTGLNLENANTVKAFLWKDLSTIHPLCISKSVPYSDKTGEFDGEWATN